MQKSQKRVLGSSSILVTVPRATGAADKFLRQKWSGVLMCVCARKMRPWQRKNTARGSILWSFIVRFGLALPTNVTSSKTDGGFAFIYIMYRTITRCVSISSSCRRGALVGYVFIRRINKLHTDAPTHSLFSRRERKVKHLKIRRITHAGTTWSTAVSMSERLNSMSRSARNYMSVYKRTPRLPRDVTNRRVVINESTVNKDNLAWGI